MLLIEYCTVTQQCVNDLILSYSGSKSMSVATNTEVLDEVTYGLTLGLGAQYGAFGTSFGINYTGSSNTDSLGVNAQARYMF